MPWARGASSSARASGARIYWKAEGRSGQPWLVLLNSIGTDMDLWDEALPMLRRDLSLLRIDTRGHGASDAPPDDYSLAMLADDVGAAMDAAGVASATVTGISLGGMIGMQLALDRPERVDRLALICTSAAMDRAAWQARVDTVRANGVAAIADLAMARFLSPAFTAERPELAAMVRNGLLDTAAAGYAGCAAAIRDMDLAPRLSSIGCSALVVTGTRDTSTPLDGHGEHLIAAIPAARHVALATAHLASVEAPAALAGLLVQFVHGQPIGAAGDA